MDLTKLMQSRPEKIEFEARS